MPTISRFDESQQLPDDPNSTDVRPERFGRDAAELAQLGGQIGQFGNKLIAARKQAMEVDAVAESSAAMRKWHTERANQLLTEDPINFADRLKGEMDGEYQKHLEAMPTGDAQRAFTSRMDDFMAGSYASTYSAQALNRVQKYRAGFDSRIQGSANAQTAAPSMNALMKDLQAHLEDVDKGEGTIYSPEEAEKMRLQAKRELVKGLFTGYTQNQELSQEGLAVLGGMSEGDILSEALSPEEVYQWRERLERNAESNKARSAHDFNVKFNSVVDSLSSADPMQRAGVNDTTIDALKAEAEALSEGPRAPLTKQDRARRVLVLDAARAIGRVVGDMEKQSPEEIQASILTAQRGYEEAVAKSGYPHAADDVQNTFIDRAKQAAAQVMKQRNDDMNAYVERVFAEDLNKAGGHDQFGVPSKERLDSRTTIAMRLGQAPTGLLTKGELSAQRMQLEALAIQNPDMATARISALNKHPYGGMIMREISRDNGVPYYIQAASFMENDDAIASVLKLGDPKRAGEIKAIEDKLSSDKEIDKFDKAMDARVEPFMRNLMVMGAANGEATTALRKVIRSEAVLNTLYSGKDYDTAVRQAYNKVIGQNFTVSGPVIMKNRVGDTIINPKMVEARMQSVYNPKNWAKWDIKLPQVPQDPDGKLASQRMQALLATGSWMSVRVERGPMGWKAQPDFEGATFMVPSPHDPKVRYPLTKRDGTPVTMNYRQATLSPVEEEVVRNDRVNRFGTTLGNALGDAAADPMMENKDKELQDMKSGWSPSWGRGRSPQSLGDAIVVDEPAYSQPNIQFDPEDDPKLIYRKMYGLPIPNDQPNPAQLGYDESALPPTERSEVKKLPTYIDPNKVVAGIEVGEASETKVIKPHKYAKSIRDAELTNGLPTGLLYWQLFQESRFMDSAKSSAGAQGIAQFMKPTAEQYGLIKGGKDYRNVPARAIPAAARYMKDLAKQFGGDWKAAVAAYNNGPGNVKKGISKFGSLKAYLAADPRKGGAPTETKEYVEAVMAGESGPLGPRHARMVVQPNTEKGQPAPAKAKKLGGK